MMRPALIIALVAAIALALTACGQSYQWNGHDISGLMPNLSFTLTAENGETVTAEAYAGKLRIVFFGYTHCPDICPMTLTRLKSVLFALSDKQRKQVRVLFVSVDPRRDGPKALRKYTAHFGPRFIGLTGTQEQLRALTKRYRVTYSYGQPNDSGFYIVSHSSAIFVFDQKGRARLLYTQDASAKAIAADITHLLTTG